MLYFEHWSKLTPEFFSRWPNFSPEEMACRGTGKLGIDSDAMDKLQRLRDLLGAPMIINSAYRSPEHNRAVGGASASQHLKARAFDVSMANHDPETFELAARGAGFTGFGFYRRNNFIHIDIGPDREWGDRWHLPKDQTRPPSRFSPPPVAVPEKLTEDRVTKNTAISAGGGLAIIGTLANVVGDLSPTAQIVAIGGALILGAGLMLIVRQRVREWVGQS